MDASETPGAVVAIVRPRVDPEPLTVAMGWADREAGREASADTMFMAGSIAKLFTATLVMQQVERGAFALDDPVNAELPADRWIRDARGAPAPVTFRQLLTHTSGLPPSWAGAATYPAPPGTIDGFLGRGLTLSHPPGARAVYANAGFVLLGDLVARRAGEPFAAHVRRQLLAPLGMPRSTFASPWSWDTGERDDLAAPYGDMFGGRARSAYVDVSAIAPASGLISSARGLSRFVRMILDEGRLDGQTFLTPESVQAMVSLEARAHPDLDEGFGLGFGVRIHQGRRVAFWDGALPGAAARLAILPEHGVGVVVLSNQTDNACSASIVGRVIDLLAPAEAPSYTPDAEALRAARGTYRMRDFVDPERGYLAPLATVDVRVRHGKLSVRSWATGTTALVPEGPGRFRFRGSAADGAGVRFEGETMYAGFVRATRLSWWRTGLARLLGALLSLAVLLGGAVQRWRARARVGPGRFEALTLAPLALRDPLRFTEVLTARHGGIVRIPAPAGRDFVLVTEPAEVERILVTDRERFSKNREFIELTSLLLGSSLLTSEGDTWLHHRRAVRPLLSGPLQRRFAEVAIASTNEMLDRCCRRAGAFDVGRETNRLALRSIGAWLGGADLARHADEIARALDTCQAFFLRRLGAAVLVRMSRPARAPRQVRRAIDRVRAITAELIERRRAEPTHDDALSCLLRADETAITDAALRDHTITMLVAGHETSGVALAFMLDLLARHPEVVARLREEADRVLGEQALTAADLPRLPYAAQVAHEVIRLYPSLPLIGRDVLSPVTVGGQPIRPGGTVIISSWAMQRRADLHPDPERFDPDRFEGGPPRGAKRFSYVPFGAGPRACTGAQMTLGQLAVAATLTARRVELEPIGAPPRARVRATLQPSHPLRVRVRPRAQRDESGAWTGSS